MMRTCSNCQKPLTAAELRKEETKGMEADRKALGLEGVLFRFYACSGCGKADIFVDVLALENETEEEFCKRRRALETAIQEVDARETEVVLVDRHTGFSVSE